MMVYFFTEQVGDNMQYTVGELIDSLSHFDRDMKIENDLILTWHHEYSESQAYDSIDDLDEECFKTCDKIWIFEEKGFEDHLAWHQVVMGDFRG